MSDKSNKGYLVHLHHIIGNLSGNSVEFKVVNGEVINIFNSVYNRTYTDENGIRYFDGTFERKDHAVAHLYRVVGQKVQLMLQKGWTNIEVKETRGKDGEIYVEVFAKSETKGWKDTFSIISCDKQ